MSYNKQQLKRKHVEQSRPLEASPPRIQRPQLAPPGLNPEPALYETKILATDISPFSVVKPGQSSTEMILKSHNPSLLAMSKRAKVAKSAMKAKPNFKYPSASHGVTSLLSKKPLSDLREPPMVVVETKELQELHEKQSIQFKEDPITYFSKRKDGRGHRFIYLRQAKDWWDPTYNPYELVKITGDEAGTVYYTMSASGVTKMDLNGATETWTLDQWAKEETVYKAIREMRTFKHFMLWKAVRKWKAFAQEQSYGCRKVDVFECPQFYHKLYPMCTMQVTDLIEKGEKIVKSHLLSIYSTRKYLIEDFKRISATNMEDMTREYGEFLDEIVALIQQLYQKVSDPALLVVTDDDFKDITKLNPNIKQMKLLEVKKEEERIRREEKMKREQNAVVETIRMLDYMLLERMRDACYDSWVVADQEMCSSQATVFQIDVSITDDGKIAFTPSHEELKSILTDIFDESTATLEHLPRLLRAADLRKMITDSDVDAVDLLDNMIRLSQMLECSTIMEERRKDMFEEIANCFDEAEAVSQMFLECYPLYKLNKTWDARGYIVTRKGQPYSGSLSIDDRDPAEDHALFLTNSDNEPYVDFDVLDSVVDQLKLDTERVAEIRSGIVRGALYIDSKGLKASLKPVPVKCFKDLETVLKQLLQYKSELLERMFKTYTLKLNRESTSLEVYVDFVDILQQTKDLMPKISDEIRFIDDLIALFGRAGFAPVENPFHVLFAQFQAAEQSAMNTKTALYEKNTFVLRQLITRKEGKLRKYRDTSMQIPEYLEGINMDQFFNQTLSLRGKLVNIQESVANCMRYQELLEVKITDFPDYRELVDNVEFAEKLYEALKQWSSISSAAKTMSFAHVTMSDFEKDVETLKQLIDNISATCKKEWQILDELVSKFEKISPYVKQLKQLSNGRMKVGHWTWLFEQCGQAGKYKPEITIQELLELGILRETEYIEKITTISSGESKIEHEFQALNVHWAEVTLPLNDPPPNAIDKKTVLTLGNLAPLFADLNDAALTLNSMLGNEYVLSIRDNVINLAQMIEHCTNVLEAWTRFEANWVILAPLFKQEPVRRSMPSQTTRFDVVRKKWKAIAGHARQDKILFNVCSFPTILQDFRENNNTLEVILGSLSPLLDAKRHIVPRFYFLSNEELLKLITTSDFTTFQTQLLKVMMHINRIDAHALETGEAVPGDEAREGCNFSGLKIFGLVGEDMDVFPFVNAITCAGAIESWIPTLFEGMERSMKEGLSISLARYSSTSLTDWVMTVSTYIAILTLQISFTRDVEQCFVNIEQNIRSFLQYELILKRRIHDLMDLANTHLSPGELLKVTNVLVLLLAHYERVHAFQERLPFFSHEKAWRDQLKFRYDPNGSQVLLEYGSSSWARGGEYWGSFPDIVITPAMEQALCNLSEARKHNEIPLLFGPYDTAKTELLKTFACYFGKFIYRMALFPELSLDFIQKVIIGTARSGAWLSFANVNSATKDTQSFIFDTVKLATTNRNLGLPTIQIDGMLCEIRKDFCIFMTSNDVSHSSLSAQLRDITRPIAMNIPSIKRLIEIKLISYGFKTAKILSNRLDEATAMILSLFESSKDRLSHEMKVTKGAYLTLRQLIHSIKLDFLDYYTNSPEVEEFALVRAAFQYFGALVDDSHKDGVAHILFRTFHLFEDDFDVFKARIAAPQNFFIDRAKDAIAEALRASRDRWESELPFDYLVAQTVALWEMMNSYPCIIIYGPSNSGKSLIVDMLIQAYKTLVSNVDAINNFKGIIPLNLVTLYQNSDSWTELFGELVEDEVEGQIWKNGTFHTAYTQIANRLATHHGIIRFDGELTPRFNSFLYQIISETNKIRTNALGSSKIGGALHCFIETDSISSLTPDLIARCGILAMNSQQHRKVPLGREISLMHPSIPFGRAAREFENVDGIDTIRSVFCDMAKLFVEKTGVDMSYSTAKFAIHYVLHQGVDVKNEAHVRIAMAYAFYTVYNMFVENQEEFESWVIENTKITLAGEWKDLTETQLPTVFTSAYPKPSLSSIRVTKDGVQPLDTEPLMRNAIFEESHFRDELIVPTSGHLTAFLATTISLKPNSHFFIYGGKNTGKSAMLNFVLKQNSDITPVIIDVTRSTTVKDVMSIIKSETNLMIKSIVRLEQRNTYALVFNGLTPEDTAIVDFVRYLVTNSSVMVTSPVDTKICDIVPFDNFLVVVKSGSRNFSERFLTHFVTLTLPQYSRDTMEYIAKKGMVSLGIRMHLVDLMVAVFNDLKYDLSEMIDAFLVFGELSIDALSQFRVFMGDVYSRKFTGTGDAFDKFLETLKSLSEKTEYKAAVIQFCNDRKFARPIQNYREEVKLIDFEDIRNQMSEQRKTRIDDESVANFINLDHSLARCAHHCIINSATGASRLAILKMVADFQVARMVELTNRKQVKEFISDLVLQDDPPISFITMRYDHHTIDLFNMLSMIFVSLNLGALFTEGEINELVRQRYDVAADAVVDQAQRAKFAQYLKRTIHSSCRLVVIPYIELSDDRFDQVTFNGPSKQAVCANLLDDVLEDLAPTFVRVSEAVEQLVPFVHVNQFYDLVNSFLKFKQDDKERNYIKNENIRIALEFEKKLNTDAFARMAKLRELEPKLKQMKMKTEHLQKDFSAKNDTVAVRKLKLAEEQMFKKQDLANVESECKFAEEDLNEIVPFVVEAEKAVGELTPVDLEPVRIAACGPNSDSVISMFTAIALMMGMKEEPAKHGQVLLLREDCLDAMKQGLNYKLVDSATYDKLIPILNSDVLQPKVLDGVAPMMVTMRTYLEAVCKYAVRNIRYKEKRLQRELFASELREFTTQMERELESFRDVEQSCASEQKEVHSLIVELTRLEKQVTEMKEEKKIIDGIRDQTDKLVAKWTKEIEMLDNHGDTLNGDCIMMAVYVCYCGMVDPQKKEEILAAALKELGDVPTTFTENTLTQIMHNLMSKRELDPAVDLTLPRDCLADFHHVLHAPRTPLVIDPDRVLLSNISSQRTVYVSLNSSYFDEALGEALKDGKHLIVTDVDNFESKLGNAIVSSKEEWITMKGETFRRHQDFSLVLCTNLRDINEIPHDILMRCTVINFGYSSLAAMQNQIVHTVIEYFDDVLMKRYAVLEKSMLAKFVQVGLFEFNCLETMADMMEKQSTDPKYRYYNDTEAVEKLMTNKNGYFDAFVTTTGSDVREEVNTLLAPLEHIIDILKIMWLCLSRYMPKINNRYQYSFVEFKRVIMRILNESRKRGLEMDEDRVSDLEQKLLRDLLKWIASMAYLNDVMFFMFFVAFKRNQFSMDDLQEIVHGLAHKMNQPIDTESEEIPMSVIETMKSMNASAFFNTAQKFIESFFGSDFYKYLPIFKPEDCFLSLPDRATFVFAPNSVDPTASILDYVSRRTRFDTFDSISLRRDRKCLDRAKKQLNSFMGHGFWLFLEYTEPDPDVAAFINDIFYMFETKPINAQFRVVINCKTTAYLSSEFIAKSNKIVLNTFPSIKKEMLSVYQSFGSQIEKCVNVATVKRVVYVGALTYAHLKFRQFMKPMGFNLSLNISQKNFQEFMDYAREFVDTIEDEENVPTRNLREFVQTICFGSGLINTQDRRRLRAILASMFAPSLLQENFKFLSKESEEEAIWKIPPDGTMAALLYHINTMPSFPSTDVMMLNPGTNTLIRDWNLSKWLAKPFISVFGAPPEPLQHVSPTLISEENFHVPDVFSPLLRFWITEAMKYNSEVVNQSYRNPEEMDARREFLVNALENVFIQKVKLRYISDPNGFFNAWRCEQGLRKQMNVDVLKLEFDASPEIEPTDEEIVLTDMFIFNGQIDHCQLLPPSPDSKPCVPCPRLIVRLTESPNKTVKTYLCPLFRRPPFHETEMHDGEPSNFIMDVPLITARGDRFWLLNSTSLFLEPAPQFS